MPPPLLSYLLDCLLPKSCLGCSRDGVLLCAACGPRSAQSGRCTGCRKPSPAGLTHPRCRRRTPLDAMLTLSAYADPVVRRALLAVKYEGVGSLAVQLGARLGTAWELVGLRRPGVLVPVPLHWTRERARGFNQAERIASGFARATGLAVAGALRRVRPTRAQSNISTERRHSNVEGAFSARGPVPERILLIDDIATSGATLESAARALKDAGALWVEAAVVAAETAAH